MKRFELITEADARTIGSGETVLIARGGHITPLARDTLRERRVTIIEERTAGADALALAPTAEIRRIVVGSDHTGVKLRKSLVVFLRGRGLSVDEVGPSADVPADYPDTAAAVARRVARDEADAGIAIDGAGLGSAIAANKIAGVRAAMCVNETLARYAREHNGANVLTLGASLVDDETARAIVATWIATPMREPRYIQRLLKIRDLERA